MTSTTPTTGPPPGRDHPDSATAARGAGHEEMFDPAEAVSGYERSPEDLLRLLVSVTVVIVVVLVTKLLSDAVGGFQRDFVALLAVGSTQLVRILEGLLALISLSLALLTLLLPLLTKRLRTFGYVLVASIVCSLVIGSIDSWLGLSGAINEVAREAGLDRGGLPDATEVAQNSAAIVVFSPFVTRRWRQTLWSLFGAMLLLQVVISLHPPAATVVALAVGPAVGSATLLLFGRPTSRPTRTAITAALAAAGLPVTSLEPASVDARGSTPYFATAQSGEKLFVKVLGANERAADLLFRLYRRLRLRNVGDERPDSSLRRTVEHEALVSLQARDVGVLTPRMRAVASVGQDSFLLAYDLIPGRSLDGVEPREVTDEVLAALWEQVSILRTHRIAHRDLRLANVFIDDDMTPWIIDFGFAEVAASDSLLHADVAQLLASLAVAVGPRRAVSSAIEGVGETGVSDCVSRLQVVALSGATQTALKEHPGLLGELRAEVISQCGIDQPEMDPLTRFRPGSGGVLATAALLLYVGVPMVIGFDDMADVVSAADWSHMGTVVAATIALLASLGWQLYSMAPATLPAWPTQLAALAARFASTTAPSNAGGNSLTARYLERHGLTNSQAVAATALGRAVNVGAWLFLLVVFLFWAGRNTFESVDVDRPEALWAGLATVAVLAGLSLLFPAVRQHVSHSTQLGTAGVRAGLAQLSGSPSRLATTASAALLLAVASLVALRNSLEVFADAPVATVGVILFAASVAATVVPTPGHVVATEVLLVAGLAAAGIALPEAVAAVLLCRLFTFWLPIVLGAPALHLLRRSDRV
ncbi:MAG: phosphotransferase [Actinomycetia bacterium]|nr:phosphotransferase [Actinomycetes bacterium]